MKTNILKNYLILVFSSFVISTNAQSTRLFVEGSAKIDGKLNITTPDDNYNTFIGKDSGESNTTGAYNTGLGYSALYSNTEGRFNVANGHAALSSNTLGKYNTAIGSYSLILNTEGENNVAVGSYALFTNTLGSENVALGRNALYANNANNNTAIGNYTLSSNTIGFNNTATGTSALASNSEGNWNTANGKGALNLNTTGDGNTALGYNALRANEASENTATGYLALGNNTSGHSNIANGARSLSENNQGYENVAVGHAALGNNTTGYRNVAVGRSALSGTQMSKENTCVGYGATLSSDFLSGGSSAFGAFAISTSWDRITIGQNVPLLVIGGYANWSSWSDGRFKENVREDVPGMQFISQLRPVTYTFNIMKLQKHITAQMPDTVAQKYYPSKETEAKAAKQIRTGFIAQEVEAVAKEIGYQFDGVHPPTNSTDNYSIEYASFVPSLVKALQEQQAIIENLKNQNIVLENRLSTIEALLAPNTSTTTLQENSSKEEARLEQNIPNPFTETTTIRYQLPKGTNAATIQIAAANGQIIQNIALQTALSHGQIELKTKDLPKGTYFYTLVVDGDKRVDTKKMVLN